MNQSPIAIQLNLNGQTLTDAEAGVPFHPGRPHILEVSPDWDGISEPSVKISVIKTLPDGRNEEQRADIESGGKHTFDLGPMTAPALYEFEAGVVYQRGYRLELRIADPSGNEIETLALHQALSATAGEGEDLRGKHRKGVYTKGMKLQAGTERLLPGDDVRIVYNPLFGIECALNLRIADDVLRDRDVVRVMARINPGACIDALDCRLEVTSPDGTSPVCETIALGPSPGEWILCPLDVAEWANGDYEITLYPVTDDRVWEEGPRIVYRRRAHSMNALQVAPFSPWALERDPSRDEIEITNFEAACRNWGDGEPDGWTFEDASDGVALACAPRTEPDAVCLRPPLEGTYAVYTVGHGAGCLVQAGDNDLVRWCGNEAMDPAIRTAAPNFATDPASASSAPLFVSAGDLSSATIRIFPFASYCDVISGLRSLKFVPVTQSSVEAFYTETSNPPTPLKGINDWGSYFVGATRLAKDQLDIIVGGQTEIGMRTLDWQLGRSTVEYHSKLPNVTIFAADLNPKDASEDLKKQMEVWGLFGMATMINQYQPLRTTLDNRARFGHSVWGWLCMNRHYGPEFVGGVYTSKFFCENPEWWRRTKDGAPPNLSWGAVCYFFPEVRRERIDIFIEAAQWGVDGLLVGCCRQVPIMLYNPEMCAAYEKETGIDPRKIDASQPDEYGAWVRWRADHFTQLLRELKQDLQPVRDESGREIPIAVRVPSAGLAYNLEQSLDVETWLREGLVDQLQIDPLESSGGAGSHDIRPYLELGRRYGIPVYGGIGCTWEWTPQGHVPAMRRALGLLDAGAVGIEIYESEILAKNTHACWTVPLFGNADRTRAFLADSNMESCYPLTASNVMLGYDIHSKWTTEPPFEL